MINTLDLSNVLERGIVKKWTFNFTLSDLIEISGKVEIHLSASKDTNNLDTNNLETQPPIESSIYRLPWLWVRSQVSKFSNFIVKLCSEGDFVPPILQPTSYLLDNYFLLCSFHLDPPLLIPCVLLYPSSVRLIDSSHFPLRHGPGLHFFLSCP